jgi:prephenate dehydrogenase
MTVKIAIIGLGQIGASIGLALAGHKDQVTTVGHDKSAAIARQAAKIGAVDKIVLNLPASVEEADVVILALPLDQVRPTLEFIRQDVREDAVIMDTAPAKVTVAGWIKELLPTKRHYIGLTPSLNPQVLEETGRGLAHARADLFAKSLMGISAPPATPGEALKLATAFVALLGAEPYFIDPVEADGVVAAAHFLPVFAAAALTETVITQPGWPDIRKLAGKSLMASMQQFLLEEPPTLADMASLNKADTLRLLDAFIDTLTSLRGRIAAGGKEDLTSRLDRTGRDLEQWRHDRHQANWRAAEMSRPEMPTAGEIMKQQLGGLDKLFGRRKKKPGPD